MQIVSATQFKSLNRNRDASRGKLGVRKQIIAPAETLDTDQRALRFCISSASVDREQDRVSVAGWDLSNFRRNPVVLWGHDATRLPIGRAFDVRVVDDRLMASVEFIPSATPEGGPFADAVYQLARGGFIAATSVGFRPTKWTFTDDPERGGDDWFPGIDFETQELVEFSVVTVPANPDALIEPAATSATASDTPPETGEELTSLNDEAIRTRARRRRLLQLAMARGPVAGLVMTSPHRG